MTQQVASRPFSAQIIPGALKMLMQFQDISYREAARRCKVSVGTIGNIVTGDRKYVNPETAGKIAKGMNVETETLFKLVSTVNLST